MFEMMRHSGTEFLLECVCYTTVTDVDDGFGDRTRAGKEYTTTHFRVVSDSKIYAAIPGRIMI